MQSWVLQVSLSLIINICVGSGKTTMLNFLSGRVQGLSDSLRMTGRILINGKDRLKMPGAEALSCYVQQDDILFQTMTVRECLIFAAQLRLQGSYHEKMERVEEVIKDLRLTKCQNTKIGGSLIKGISGGERKRTAIGVELIMDPQLIFLDEPTTGLDSYTAASVMETLRALSASGRTVISTIHQPNSEIFDNFDRLMLIANGRIIYMNDAHKSSDYFAKIGYDCPAMSNPADYFMTVMSPENSNDDEYESDSSSSAPKRIKTEAEIMIDYNKKIEHLALCYQESDLKNDYAFQSKDAVPIHPTEIHISHTTWLQQLWLLTKRSFNNIMRLPDALVMRVFGNVAGAVFINIIFQELKGNLEGVTNRNGALFFIITCITFNAILATILLFPEERPVFLREAHNKMYTVSAYFFGKLLSELPSNIILPILNASILYFYIGLNNAEWKFILHVFVQMILYTAGMSYTLIISVSFSDKKLAVSLIPLLLAPFMLLSGFIVNQKYMPFWLKPFNYLSFYKYGFQAMMLNEYEGLLLECMEIPKNNGAHCDPLGDFNSPQTFWESIGSLCAVTVGCFALSLGLMKILSKRSF